MTFHNHWFVDLRVSNCELHRWIHKLVTSLVHHIHPVPAPRPRYPELWRWNVWPVHESGEISTKTKNGFWEDGKNMFGHKSNIKQVPWKSIERCWKFLVDSQIFLKIPSSPSPFLLASIMWSFAVGNTAIATSVLHQKVMFDKERCFLFLGAFSFTLHQAP